jgi:peptidoglycan hydrolase-like protein with peptidoglycan-binding domain
VIGNESAVRWLQSELQERGLYSGARDGDFGPLTTEAVRALLGTAQVSAPAAAAPGRVVYPRQSEMVAFYGPAGAAACTAGKVKLPFPFIIAWNTAQKISTFSCHARLEAPMTAIFAEAAKHYGEARFRALRLDLFGGCYNYRPMRGGTSLSTHAWGAAVDLDPERNQLTWGADRASFDGPDYLAFWGIVEAHGGVSLGRARNRDWMHFQFARI